MASILYAHDARILTKSPVVHTLFSIGPKAAIIADSGLSHRSFHIRMVLFIIYGTAMLVVISPAKTLDFESPARTAVSSTPELLKDSETLIKQLRKYSPSDLSELMGLSDKLAVLNSTRYEAWHLPFTPANAKQALLAFRGDVYQGLDADSLTAKDDTFAQQHLRILSGLYGVLKPLDLIQPYRLEMGTALATKKGKDLYHFWGNKLTDLINAELAAQQYDTLINLASNEYFKAIQPKRLNARIITPVFKDEKNGKYKVISFFAKKARGMMTRFIIKKRITNPEKLKNFSDGGYRYNPQMSSDREWVFSRAEIR